MKFMYVSELLHVPVKKRAVVRHACEAFSYLGKESPLFSLSLDLFCVAGSDGGGRGHLSHKSSSLGGRFLLAGTTKHRTPLPRKPRSLLNKTAPPTHRLELV